MRILLLLLLLLLCSATINTYLPKISENQNMRDMVAEFWSMLKNPSIDSIHLITPDYRENPAEHNFVKTNKVHVRNLANSLLDNGEELQRNGYNVARVYAAIAAHDLGKVHYDYHQELYEKAKQMEKGQNLQVILNHEEASFEIVKKLGEKHNIPQEEIAAINQIIKNHNGPAVAGSWWKTTYESVMGKAYNNPEGKDATLMSFLDRLDQANLEINPNTGAIEGGVRKIVMQSPTFSKANTVNGIAGNVRGTLKQLDELIRINPNLGTLSFVKRKTDSMRKILLFAENQISWNSEGNVATLHFADKNIDVSSNEELFAALQKFAFDKDGRFIALNKTRIKCYELLSLIL